MSQGASHYPIVQFISRLMQECELSRIEFVHSLGYRKHPDKGLRRLNPWLDDGDGYGLILKRMAAKYPGHAAGLENGLIEGEKS